ncbi:RNA polymerase sigma factor [Actinoplanes teichomyceticus]|uniref:RNA polymerase ECF family sigma subunit n=1 Tax=Actinoplanes teichomyceticus TaxID=1867 RepID=A0A561VR07_ACTTI|nr:sigma-70 family RNA polymerase sigma factor [Actinoplanes teichomyceticus]TWG14057.1 RNA polymerase ECF family sigma subunit [Actinoplanes teichomyceticus]GIF16791.1 RNA polymerase subunit sigma-24 [Actinoplanes teichomyceticus]
MSTEARAVAAASRDAYARIVATLIRLTGDWSLAEDCAQDAIESALRRWPRDGVPANPGGWLMTAARNRAVDQLRRAATAGRKLRDLALLREAEPAPEGDDRLRLIFTCCHPALAPESRVALTLRTVAGVPTADVARLFLVSESAMTRRLTRAKSKIAQSRIPYRAPSGPALAERLPGVLAVLYLLFTHGYDAGGELDAADEAIHLARLLAELMPAEPEVSALLALCLLQHSRRAARRDAAGELVTLDRQDRSRWDHAAIAEAVGLLAGRPVTGAYAIQAHIAACHATAPDFASTDWSTLAGWYDQLARIHPSPVVAVNRAVAHGYAYGPAAGLDLLAGAGDAVAGYAPAVAARAQLAARAGDPVTAAALFRRAAGIAASEGERRALMRRAAETEAGVAASGARRAGAQIGGAASGPDRVETEAGVAASGPRRAGAEAVG